MRVNLYCHWVRSEDDGRTTAYMSAGEGATATIITITAPFEAFDEDEMLRGGFWHKIKFKTLNVP
jgi:hypothetical protein